MTLYRGFMWEHFCPSKHHFNHNILLVKYIHWQQQLLYKAAYVDNLWVELNIGQHTPSDGVWSVPHPRFLNFFHPDRLPSNNIMSAVQFPCLLQEITASIHQVQSCFRTSKTDNESHHMSTTQSHKSCHPAKLLYHPPHSLHSIYPTGLDKCMYMHAYSIVFMGSVWHWYWILDIFLIYCMSTISLLQFL